MKKSEPKYPVQKRSPKRAPRSPAEEIVDSAHRGELVVVVGTGSSLSLTDGSHPSLSWRGLVSSGFEFGLKKGKITDVQANFWAPQLASNDLDDLLSAAEFVSRKLGAPVGDLYARWLEGQFRDVAVTNTKMKAAIQAIQASQVPICTLNYDTLLEQVTDLPGINIDSTNDVLAWMRRETQGVLHLHGSWPKPASCVLGIRDYESTVRSDVRDLIQRSLASFKRLLFVGCGDTFSDPNFSALIAWLRLQLSAATPQHYALVSNAEYAPRHADPAWHGFVEPLSYGSSHDELSEFLLKLFPTLSAHNPKKARAPSAQKTVAVRAALLEAYKSFLVKDCGQMTIEGVRADMDTAQRRFDLERLFVPLQLTPCAPDFPITDPSREQKLAKWLEENSQSRPFGEVFASKKGLALLALPGGGKSLLLKRVAVAYADTSRRAASADMLPDIDLMPVLIRCREWRDYIHLPILTLLQSIPAITGQPHLTGLHEALIPLLKRGSVLLLVDGLDEIHDDAQRATFVDHLEAFMDQFHKTRLVVTSREAGFDLVAPSLERFCERWRVASLQEDEITLLCDHWHRLMLGEGPEVTIEAAALAQRVLRNPSLRRLAENPLLLTMLLVVKHGAGRLPPDKVSLYGRAVEVLLDTWNIKGHTPLNIKEAEPQLAYVAFQLMQARKQTATEAELIALFEEARERVPQIRRYAKDSPHEFLKRVELRSSLLLEAGHQTEAGRLVPFYQFRHLTFQEYLAAVAVAQGHYAGYSSDNTVLTPLKPVLENEEWKEVIPMAAVLARKQAEPLMAELVASASKEYGRLLKNPSSESVIAPPASVARLFQCLVEEAEAAPKTLTSALQLVATFGRGLRADEGWIALARGPYAEEFLHQAWILFSTAALPNETWIRNTLASLAAHRHASVYGNEEDSIAELSRLLNSSSIEANGLGLLICCGLKWNGSSQFSTQVSRLFGDIEPHLFSKSKPIWMAATWCWALFQKESKKSNSGDERVLDRLLELWLTSDDFEASAVSFALSTVDGLAREEWSPNLSSQEIEIVKMAVRKRSTPFNRYAPVAAGLIAFYSKQVWPDSELSKVLQKGGEELANSKSEIASNLKNIIDQLERAPTRPVRALKGASGKSRESRS